MDATAPAMSRISVVAIDQYRMMNSVRGTLATHETDDTWTEIPALTKAVGDLDTVIDSVATQLEATSVRSGASAGKSSALKALSASATIKSPPKWAFPPRTWAKAARRR
jgi:hypothetical protein